MRKYLFGLIFFSFCLSASAQNRHLDTIRASLTTNPKFVIGLHNRYALVSGSPQRTLGAQAGVEFDKIFRIIFGINWMPKAFTEFETKRNGFQLDTITTKTELLYFSLTGEYAFYRSNKWKVSTPLLMGVGTIQQHTSRSINQTTESTKSTIVPVELGVTGIYYLTDWLGLKAGVGNRFTLGKSYLTTSGPYYALGVSLLAEPIFKRFKNRKVKN